MKHSSGRHERDGDRTAPGTLPGALWRGASSLQHATAIALLSVGAAVAALRTVLEVATPVGAGEVALVYLWVIALEGRADAGRDGRLTKRMHRMLVVTSAVVVLLGVTGRLLGQGFGVPPGVAPAPLPAPSLDSAALRVLVSFAIAGMAFPLMAMAAHVSVISLEDATLSIGASWTAARRKLGEQGVWLQGTLCLGAILWAHGTLREYGAWLAEAGEGPRGVWVMTAAEVWLGAMLALLARALWRHERAARSADAGAPAFPDEANEAPSGDGPAE